MIRVNRKNSFSCSYGHLKAHRILLGDLWFAKTEKLVFLVHMVTWKLTEFCWVIYDSRKQKKKFFLFIWSLESSQNSVGWSMIRVNRKNKFFLFMTSLEHLTEFCWVVYDLRKQEKQVFLIHDVIWTLTEFCWVIYNSHKQEKLVFLVHDVIWTPCWILLGDLWFA